MTDQMTVQEFALRQALDNQLHAFRASQAARSSQDGDVQTPSVAGKDLDGANDALLAATRMHDKSIKV